MQGVMMKSEMMYLQCDFLTVIACVKERHNIKEVT